MNHLCYINIFDYRNLHNVDMSFDSRYDFSLDRNRNVLSIEKRKGVPDGFWGKNVYSLTAIVGNNGAGKSTALRFILEALVDGSWSRKELKGMIVTVDDEERFSIYVPEELQRVHKCNVKGVIIDSIDKMEDLPSMETLYYGSHFNPLTTPEDILTIRWTGLMNISDGYLLTRDLQDYGNNLATNGIYPFRDYATAFNSQNQYRICYFLNQYDSAIKKSLRLPKYLMIFPNKAGQWALTHKLKAARKSKLPEIVIPENWNARNKALADIIYHNMLNVEADGMTSGLRWIPLLRRWIKYAVENQSNNIVDTYLAFIQTIKSEREKQLCMYIYECANILANTCRDESNVFYSWLYYDIEEDKACIEMLLGWIVSHRVYLTCRFFDMQYAHDFKTTTFLSSGEQEMLNLYSRIYDSVVRIKQRGFSEDTPQLFIFDEAEIGYHPEWQRQFVNNIVKYLNDMAGRYNLRCQIVLTSHSPIILSDIPVECCNMLLKDDEKNETVNVTKSRKQTFGTNVFELYRDSFFLNGGMMGEFASNYIQQLNEEIDKANEDNDEFLEERISLIGDRVIRDYLMSKLRSHDKKWLKAYYSRALKELDDEQD